MRYLDDFHARFDYWQVAAWRFRKIHKQFVELYARFDSRQVAGLSLSKDSQTIRRAWKGPEPDTIV